jgi:hypothetical protein
MSTVAKRILIMANMENLMKHLACTGIAAALALVLQSNAVLAAKPHVHGVGALQLVVEDHHLHIEISLPAMDVVGFEHAPRTVAQRDAVTQAAALLKDVRKMLELPTAAECTVASSAIESALLEDQQKQHHDHDHDEVHADFDIAYRFDCRRPEALTSLKVNIFERLPRLEKLEVQSVMPSGQRRQSLTPGQPTITLP